MSGMGDREELLCSLVGEAEFPSAGLAGVDGPEGLAVIGWLSFGVGGPGRLVSGCEGDGILDNFRGEGSAQSRSWFSAEEIRFCLECGARIVVC